MTARLIGTQFPAQGCMDAVTSERSFDSKAMWVIGVLSLLFLPVILRCLFNQAVLLYCMFIDCSDTRPVD